MAKPEDLPEREPARHPFEGSVPPAAQAGVPLEAPEPHDDPLPPPGGALAATGDRPIAAGDPPAPAPSAPAPPAPAPPAPAPAGTRPTGGFKAGRTRLPHTRIGAAWTGVWAGVVVVILLIVFIGQNTAKIRINFLWLDGEIPTALALLIAGVAGAVIAIAVGAARIVQLRREFRRDHH